MASVSRHCVGVAMVGTLLILFSGGCTKTSHARVARYELGDDAPISTAPRTGVYSVKWTRTPGKNLRNLAGTETLVYRGEQVGFETQDDGSLVAVAGQRRVPIDHLPSDARMIVWYHKSQRQTQLGKEVGKAIDTAATVAVVGTGVAAIGAGIGAAAYLDARYGNHDDDCKVEGR